MLDLVLLPCFLFLTHFHKVSFFLSLSCWTVLLTSLSLAFFFSSQSSVHFDTFLHWFWTGHGVFLNDFCWDWLCCAALRCGVMGLSPLSTALLGPSPWRFSSNITWPSQVGCHQPHQEHTLKSTGAAADTVSCTPPPHCFYCYLSCLLPRMTQGEALLDARGFGEGCLAKGEMYL